MKRKVGTLRSLAAALVAATVLTPNIAQALTVKEAVAVALESNPEIGQAAENREAIEFELRQARGLYLPSVDLEAGVGARRLDNPSRRAAGIEDDELYPTDVGLSIKQKLFDGGGRRAELERQAQSGKDLAVTGTAGAATVHGTVDLEALAMAVVGAVAGGP